MKHPSSSRFAIGLFSLLPVLAVILPCATMAATYEVTTTADEFDTPSGASLSLREAIRDANATPDDDRINLPAGTYTLTRTGSGEDACATGDLDVTDNGSLEIAGAAANTTCIDAGGSSGLGDRVIEALTGANLYIYNLTVTGGHTANVGGGIYNNQGTTTIVHSTISGNTTNSFGGGINTFSGSLNIFFSTISNNSAYDGGGIYSNTDFSGISCNLFDSTIAANTAITQGGGIANIDGLTQIIRCTISGNTAPGGGGGVTSAEGVYTKTLVKASIISGNDSDVDVTLPVSSGINSITSADNNLIGKGNAIGAFSKPGDIIDVTDPLLAPLGYCGGSTRSMHPLANSPAIDGGGSTDPGTIDQRGFSRFVNGALDIGAIEAGPALTVTTADDAGAGSLREALLSTPIIPGQRILFDHTFFTFPEIYATTIYLTSGQLNIAGGRSLFIDASNIPDGVRISAERELNSRVLFVDGSTTTAALHSITIRRGQSASTGGGGIYNHGATLTLSDCTVSYNETTGVNAYGGGIYSASGTLSLSACTVLGNQSTGANAHGGGIYSADGPLILTGCAVLFNQTSDASANGGGVFSNTNLIGQTATLTNCTIYGNITSGRGGGYHNQDGLARIIHCTVTNNTAPTALGGGIASFGDTATRTELKATIIRDNLASDVDFVSYTINSFASLGTNLVGTGSAVGAFTVTGDQTGTSTPVKLAPLGKYSGQTKSRPPILGSPAIDAATSSTLATDQRGIKRPLDGDGNGTAKADIGAVEIGTPIIVDTVTDENDGAGFGLGTSLRDAIALADNTRQMIIFKASLNAATISLMHGELLINKPLVIDASSLTGGIIIDGGSNGDFVLNPGETRCLNIEDADYNVVIPVNLRHLTIRNGVHQGAYGGANIQNLENLTLNDCTISGGRSIGEDATGGGIYSERGTLTLTACTVTNNQTSGDKASGGGIYCSGSFFILTNCTISRNQTSGDDASGGGIYSSDSFFILTNCIISHNQTSGASAYGGGIASNTSLTGYIATLTNCTIHANSSGGGGGGYYNEEGLTHLIHCTVTVNTAPTAKGGGIGSYGDTDTRTELTSTIVRNNLASDVDFIAGATNTFLSHGSNLIGTGTAAAAFTATGDQTGTSNLMLLAPLGNYGGPTATRPPLPGSPAIDASASSTLVTDQRNARRPNGPLPDIGAVEAYAFSLQPLIDTDGDGIDDRLEGPNGCYPHLTIGTDDSALDTDGDGRSDAVEIADMTDLYDPTDFFRILSFTPAPGFDPMNNPVFTLTLKTFPGLKYEIEKNKILKGLFTPLPGTQFTAGDHTSTINILLTPKRDFVRAVRK